MRLRKFKTILLAGFILVGINLQAQKFGYLNSVQLLAELPEVKSADSELETYQRQLMSSGESMVKKLEAKYQDYAKKAQEGMLSQVDMQQKEQELATEQKKIQEYELEVQNKILAKREELYKPILDKVKVALEAIGKEQGYTMIFDSSAGSILHANDSENVLDLVKTKLGI